MTRRIKTTVVRENVNPQVAERRSWAKFGHEKGHAAGPSFETTSVGENIAFRPSVNWKSQAADAEKEGGEKGSVKDQLKDKKVKCRICSGEHFTARCPFKDTMAPIDEPSAGGDGAGADEPAEGGLGGGTSSYVPPHLRKGAAAGGEKMGGKYEKDDLATLRVTNVRSPPAPPFQGISVSGGGQSTDTDPATGERAGRGTGIAGSVRTFRPGDKSVPGARSRDTAGQGLCVYQLCRPVRCGARVREDGRLYVFAFCAPL